MFLLLLGVKLKLHSNSGVYVFSLYALLSKKHAKVMEYIKQDEKNSQENVEGAQHSDHVSQQFLFNFTCLDVGGELDGKESMY